MEIIIFITVLVLMVSLYDFATSRSWQEVTSSSRNEVVFDDRNKTYGAYEIRRNYDKTLILILLGVTASIGLLYGAYLFVKALPEEVIPPPPVMQFVPITPPIDKDVIVPPPPSPEPVGQRLQNSMAFPPLQITDNPIENNVPTQSDLQNNNISTVGIEDGENGFDPPKPISTPGVVEPTSGGGGIPTFVDIEASFPGGYKKMVEFLSKHIKYPEAPLQAGIGGRVTLNFVVGKDGGIENVSVVRGVPGCPECDKEAMRVVKLMPKWKPAELNGNLTKSYFNLPITFEAE